MPATKEHTQNLTVAENGTYSTAFNIKTWAVFIGAIFPAMDNGVIGIEISNDGGTTYYPILDPADGDDLVVCASGADPCAVDISDYIRFVPSNDLLYYVRFTCAAQSSGAVTIHLMQRG